MTKPNQKSIVITKHIHSSFASCSTGDEFLVIVTNSKDIDFKIKEGNQIQSKKFPGLNGEVIDEAYGDSKYVGIYLESEKTFYHRDRGSRGFGESYSKTPEFIALVNSYIEKGFKRDRDIPEQKAYWAREKKKQQKKLKKSKIVLWMGYDAYVGHPEFFQGGFSDEVFNSPKLKAYVSRGSCFGWIGNSEVRTAAHDKQIEAGLRKRGISPSEMYNWISSSDGRHFADSLGGYTAKEQKEKIKNYLNHMYNKCLVFGTPTHEGTLTSSIKIEECFEKFNILLPHNEPYNHNKHMNNLMLARKKLHQKEETLTPEELYLDNIIGDIFANKV